MAESRSHTPPRASGEPVLPPPQAVPLSPSSPSITPSPTCAAPNWMHFSARHIFTHASAPNPPAREHFHAVDEHCSLAWLPALGSVPPEGYLSLYFRNLAQWLARDKQIADNCWLIERQGRCEWKRGSQHL